MKGVVEIEFVISVFVFITTVSFVTGIVISNLPVFHSASTSETLKSKSWQYSEMLLFDEGAPLDWQLPDKDIKRIGLSTGSRYFLDESKIIKLYDLCSVGYAAVKDKLGVDTRNDIVIEVSYLDGSPVASSVTVCGPNVITQIRPSFQTVRLGVLNTADRPIVRIKVIII
ncbi:MAG: hypothetical protein WC613_03505 [Candidatus Aenigmatarchaeota archaeon]